MKYFLIGLILNIILFAVLFIMFKATNSSLVQPKYKVCYEYNVYRQYIKLNNGYYKVIADTIAVDTVYTQIK